MPKPKKQGKQKSQLGRALIKNKWGGKNARQTIAPGTMKHTSDLDDANPGLASVTEATDVAEFMQNAMLANKTFEGERTVYGTSIQASSGTLLEVDPTQYELDSDEDYEDDYGEEEYDDDEPQAPVVPDALAIGASLTPEEVLVIPRRPAWDKEMTKEVLNENEKQSFLTWRRNLAMFEEANYTVVVTPFEKNLQVWRQLWRVLERSDIVCQIIDCRNPLVFRCEDLEKYVKEIDPRKKVMLLINKADLLPKSYRLAWTRYFQDIGIDFKFFSAGLEQEKLNEYLDEQELLENNIDSRHADLLAGEAALTVEANDTTAPEAEAEEEEAAEPEAVDDAPLDFPPEHVYSREELLATFSELAKDPTRYNADRRDRATIGFVGFPNVGKSSTINVLYGQKRVAVGATPGKTKHFQTLLVGEDIELCDCPGLVFPSTATTKAEMTCNGILPIDQMRDHRGPLDHLCRLVPRSVFEVTYGVTIPRPHEDEDANRPPTQEEVSFTVARNRGFMSSSGPDGSRAARLILKDYVNGKLLHCHPPPGMAPAEAAAPAAAIPDGDAIITTDPQLAELREMQHAGKTLKVNKLYANAVAEGGLSVEDALGDQGMYSRGSGVTVAGRKGGKRRKGKKGRAQAIGGEGGFTRVQNTHYTPIPRAQLQAMIKAQKRQGGAQPSDQL